MFRIQCSVFQGEGATEKSLFCRRRLNNEPISLSLRFMAGRPLMQLRQALDQGLQIVAVPHMAHRSDQMICGGLIGRCVIGPGYFEPRQVLVFGQ